ncbi:MAG TPA: hypothetical protein VJ550_11590 [Geomonas sp.]|nr:hypothetical protein [Geomonas sp.]
MNCTSSLSRVVLSSPAFLLLFLVIPVCVVLNLVLHLGIPLVDFRLMLANNICFALLVAVRLVYYLGRASRPIRYGEAGRPGGEGHRCPVSQDQARGELARAGFAFDARGAYGEKRDRGYLGTVIFYLGLLLLLATGCWDNLHQFAGVLLDGVGPATPLSKVSSYKNLSRGLMAGNMESLPDLRVLSQTLPDFTFPKGTTEIALVPKDGDPTTTLLVPGEPVRYGAYEIYMSRLIFEPEIVIKTRDGKVLFDDRVKLEPLVKKRGEFTFYGAYAGAQVLGGAYFNPDKNQLMMVVTRNGKREVADLVFQVDQQVSAGDYILSCARLGEWSEIHVVHHRHKGLLIAAGILAVLGLLLRTVYRPQRVWLEDAEAGCRLHAVGNDWKGALKAE